MRQHLHAPRGAGREHGIRAGRRRDRLRRRGPRRPGVGGERVAGGVVHLGDAVRAELVGELLGQRAHDEGVHRRPGPVGQRAGERDGLQRHLGRAVRRGLHEHEDHRDTPRRCSRSTTAAAASGPSPSTSTVLGWAGGKREPHPSGAARILPRRDRLDRGLLRLHPPGDRRVARLDAALQHGHHGGQRHRVGLDAVDAVAARGGDAVGDLHRAHAVDHRAAQLVGEPDADLEVAGVGGVVAQQDQVVGVALGLVGLDDRGDFAVPRRRARSRPCRPRPAPPRRSRRRARRAAARPPRPGPRVSTVAVPPSAPAIRTASSTAQFSCALTVKPTNRASSACSSAVSSTSPAASGTRLMQTSTFVMCS